MPWHTNPEGRTLPCENPEKCPWPSFPTEAEAQAAHGASQSSALPPPLTISPNRGGLYDSLRGQDRVAIRSLVDRRGPSAAYYAATDRKHFGDDGAPGSTFLAPTLRRCEDVLALALLQRGTLGGDDREMFLSHGMATEGAFSPGCRYLMVETPGTVGIVSTTGYPDHQVLSIVRTKPDTPPNLVLLVQEQPTTGRGVVILGPDAETGRETLFTAYPGGLTPRAKGDAEMEARIGGTITVGELRARHGRDVHVQTLIG